ncbi:MAG: HD domain-containing phosphohydrolase [bacterium]
MMNQFAPNSMFYATGMLIFLILLFILLFILLSIFKRRSVLEIINSNPQYKEDFKSINQELSVHINALKEANARISGLYNQVDKTAFELNKKVEELKRINEIGKAISSSLDLNEVLETILWSGIEWTRATHGAVMLLDPVTNTLAIKYAIGINSETLNNFRLNIGEGIAGWVIKEKKTAVVDKETDDPRFKTFKPGLNKDNSLLAVPLIYRDNATGVLNLSSRDSRKKFTEEDVSFVTTIASHAAIAIENANLYEGMQHNYFEIIKSLALTLEAKDHYSHGHSERVTYYAKEIAKEMRLPGEDVKLIESAGILHDIGKIGISEQILNKKNPLSEGEWKVIEKHPLMAESIIEPIHFLAKERSIIRNHHERYDGKGYPDGLAGEEISIHARILTVADAFDSMTTDRPYRKALSVDVAIERLKESAGTQFDKNVVDAFLRFYNKKLG